MGERGRRGRHLVSVIWRLRHTTGLKPRRRGYRSMGLRVPLVMMTDWKRLNTGAMARLASRHASWMTGSLTVGMRSSYGSMITWGPGAPQDRREQGGARFVWSRHMKRDAAGPGTV